MKEYCVAAALLALAGCASITPVTPMGPDTYMIANRSQTAFATGGEMLADLYREANAFCINQSKQMMPVSTSSRNGAPYQKATGELQFMCLRSGDRDLARPRLEPAPDITIQSR